MIRSMVVLMLVLVGAVSFAAEIPYKRFVTQNSASINKLAVGMTKDQVLQLMGDNTSKVKEGKLGNPYKTEAFQNEAGNFEILYYLTRVHPPFTPILDNQMTPVVLKDGLVTGWGRNAVTSLKR